MTSNGYICLNGRTINDRPAKYTFSNKVGKSAIDLVSTNINGLTYIEDLTVDFTETGSDHFAVMLDLAIEIEKKTERSDCELNATKTIMKWTENNRSVFKDSFQISSADLYWLEKNVTDLNEILRLSIRQAGIATGGHKRNKNYETPVSPENDWFDGECARAKKATQQLLSEYHHSGFNDVKKSCVLLILASPYGP